MAGFAHIDRLEIPVDCLEAVYRHLRAAGAQEVEGVALWAGTAQGSVFHVKATIIPEQNAYKLEDGLLYSVEGDELHRINVWLYKNELQLIAQLHSHPGQAYHSETDDAYPIIAVLGGISIVIPDFAARSFDLEDWAVYRLSDGNGWVGLDINDVKNLIEIS